MHFLFVADAASFAAKDLCAGIEWNGW